MRLITSGTAMCMAMALLAGCKPAAESVDAAPAVQTAAAPGAAESEPAGAEDDGASTTQTIGKREAMQIGVAMVAAAELCGVGNAVETQAALAKIKAEPDAPSAAEVDAIYTATKQQAKAQAAADPAAFERSCADMRKMADPAEVAKIEAATKKLEAMAAKMEAEAKAKTE